MNDPVTIAAIALTGTLTGGAMGAIIAHFTARKRDAINEQRILDRERRERKRRLSGVLYRWRCQFQRCNGDQILDCYRNIACEITYEAGIICGDFADRKTFDGLVGTASSFKKADIDESGHEDGRKKILSAIDGLIRFVESA